MRRPAKYPSACLRGGSKRRFFRFGLAFFWLALWTLTFWVSLCLYNKEAKSLTFRRGSEVSQVRVSIRVPLRDSKGSIGVLQV